MKDVEMRDYRTLANALGIPHHPGRPGRSMASTASWDLKFSGVISRKSASDPVVRFAGDYVETGAHLDWSMSEQRFSFRSNPYGQNTLVAFIGRERNGVFFGTHGDDDSH